MAHDPIDPTGILAELTAILRSDRRMSEILVDVVHLAKRQIPGADEASITLIRNEKATTAALTGELALVLDELQYEAGYGPCLDAGRADEVNHIEDAAVETRWPRYLPAARRHGLGSSLSLPIPVENHLVGALNIYSRTAHAFPAEVVTLGDALAAHITAALCHAEAMDGHRNKADHLLRAMETRAVIEQAKGMIMAQRKCTAAEAFDQLRNTSMNQNIKLADLAAGVVSSASGHPVRFLPFDQTQTK